jgi:hypothetical protein
MARKPRKPSGCQGSRLITDWESHYPAGEALAPVEKRKERRVAQRLRELSQTYGLASREVSLVAVVKRAGDRLGELPETQVVPVGMAQDVGFDSYISRPALFRRPATPKREAFSDVFSRVPRIHFSFSLSDPVDSLGSAFAKDDVIALCVSFDPDGGMPGGAPEDRAASSIAALFAFLEHGHTSTSGAFREHVARLIAFLESITGLRPDRQKLIGATLAWVRKGKAPAGDWVAMASRRAKAWGRIEKVLREQGEP